ncbi:MAG TPA: DNA translocase FtsK [Solirubrobacteraceae bacterium]|nr:DNA translocase FtsK [Solirubrobacteraceae bacterium]
MAATRSRAGRRKSTRTRPARGHRARPARRRRARRARSQGALRGVLAALVHLARESLFGGPLLSAVGREIIGWALCALAVFSGLVIYGSFDGGGVGHALGALLALLAGGARYLAPLAFLAGGALFLLRPAPGALEPGARGDRDAPARAEDGEGTRPLRGGVICLYAAVTLALADGVLGVSSGQSDGRVPIASGGRWSLSFLRERGGAPGEALWVIAHALAQEIGVAVLCAFLFLAAITLLSGASVGVLARLGRLALRAGRALALGLAPPRRHPRLAHERSPEGAELWSLPAGAGQEASFEPGAAVDIEPGEQVQGGEAPQHAELKAPELQPYGEEEPQGAEALLAEQEPDTLPVLDAEEDPGDAEPPGSERSAHRQRRAEALGVDPRALTPQGRLRELATDDPSFEWRPPDPAGVLTRSRAESSASADRAAAEQQAKTGGALVEALGHFGVQAKVIGTVCGPHITRYELRLAPGTKVAKVAQLKDDLAYALAATDIRILAPIPGKQAVGVEVPNPRRRIVHLGDVFGAPPRSFSPLTVWLGKDVAGKAVAADLAKMPHLLVAGATGSGKSGAVNAMLASVLLRATPREVRLVLVDPKQVELNHYESIPHLLTPVIVNPRMAANALANLVREMESRYSVMSLARTRSLVELNQLRTRRGEAPLPYVLCVIDELADLMMVAPADVEDSIIRLAQKARAVGIHLVLATQSPRVDVITGMIKANVPSRIAFAVSSQTDSRVILDQNGAESLLGQGDMLYSPMGSAKLQRIQGAYIDEGQIARLTEHWRRQGEPELHEELLEEREEAPGDGEEDPGDPDSDPLLREAITLVVEMQTASTSMMQRRLRVGYTRAGRLIDMLERRGIISGYEGSKPRAVLISAADLPRVLAAYEESAVGASPSAPEEA